MSTRRDFAAGAIGFSASGVAVIAAAPAKRTLYIPTSTLEAAFETLLNAPGAVEQRSDAEALAKKRSETVYRVTVEKL